MSSPYNFKTGVIRPVECLRQGWEIIKDQFWMIFGITFVGIIIAGIVPFGILMGAMFCGIYYAIFQKMNGRQASFEDLFKGFNFFKQSLVASLFLIIPMVIAMVIIYVPMIAMQIRLTTSKNPNPNELFAYFGFLSVAMIIFSLVLGTIHALMIFAFPLIVEHNLSGVEAFKLSARAVMKNSGGVILFILCQFGLILVGYLMCVVGVYLVLPIMYAGTLVMYRAVFPGASPQRFNNPPPPNAFRGAGNYN